MSADLAATLRTYFGFSSFRPGQREAIQYVLDGKSTLVVMPTGAGKSLVYQLSALSSPGVTLVISPLIALMKDQVDGLTRRGIAATYVNSTLPGNEQASRLQAIAAGAYRLVYVAPERLRSVSFQQSLRGVHVSLLAVDEAHCISAWGHDFRPDYLQIAAARAQLGNPVTVALTATATPQVQDDIAGQLGLAGMQRVVTGFNRPNLALEVNYVADDAAKLRQVQALLAGLDGGAAIVYVGTRHEAEEVAEFIAGLMHASLEAQDVRYYHAGLDAARRSEVQEAFVAGDLRVIVATNAFGMGIDRPDVRLVVHYNMPGTLEAYYQEAGRAGRDGDPARAVLLYSPRDRALQEWFIENSVPSPGDLRTVYAALPPSGDTAAWVGRDSLSLSTGLADTKIRVALAQLEAAGVVEYLGDSGTDMLLRKQAWHETASNITATTIALHRRHRLAQLEAMVRYGETDSCRRRILLDHFGDSGPADAVVCCDNCQARQAAESPAGNGSIADLSHVERAALIILDTVRRLKWSTGRTKLAQTLAGSHAKAMSASGYDQNVYYGRLAVFKCREIEEMISRLVSMGYLKITGSEQPVLRLTPKGESAIKARVRIPLPLTRPVDEQQITKRQAQRQAGGTAGLTLQMLSQGLAPAQIAAQRSLAEDTIYNHLAQPIAQGSLALDAVVAPEVTSQVREAITKTGSADRLAPLRAILPQSISYGQIRCVAEHWKREHAAPPPVYVAAPTQAGDGAVAAFLSHAHPRPLAGPWQEGWALSFHSSFAGADRQRSQVGELMYRLKYESDPSAVQPLVEQALALCREHPGLAAVDALVPVAPTVLRTFDPVAAFTAGLATALGKPVLSALAKTRRTEPQKGMTTLVQKRNNVAGAFAVPAALTTAVRGRRLLVVDDLFDSGATLEEATHVLLRAGAAAVCVLTLTRTIHTD